MSKILVVDDEETVREMLSRLLRQVGYSVEEAESAEEALEVVGGDRFDLIITDFRMKEMDGLSLSQKLLEQDADRPVLMMTAYAELESARKAISIGIYEYFVKPFDISDVMASVKRALQHRQFSLGNKEYQRDLEIKVEERTEELKKLVRQLKARDELLRSLLSINPPGDNLRLALGLACSLAECEAGALYMVDEKGCAELSEATGFSNSTGLDKEAKTKESIAKICQQRRGFTVDDPGDFRRSNGIFCFGMFPIARVDEIIAILEVDRKSQNVLLSYQELEELEEFLPYMGFAVVDFKLQKELPEWQGNIEDVLKMSSMWTE